MNTQITVVLLLSIVLATAGCTTNQGNNTSNQSGMALNSSAFSNDGAIPVKYTAKGDNLSPPLSWSSAPNNTKSFAVLCQDPDAAGGNFTHWIIFNLPANTSQLNEAVPANGTLANGAKQGNNDFGKVGYSGPDPPSGVHHYVFTVYALDSELNLNPGANKSDFLNAIKGHVLAQGTLTGTYGQ